MVAAAAAAELVADLLLLQLVDPAGVVLPSDPSDSVAVSFVVVEVFRALASDDRSNSIAPV